MEKLTEEVVVLKSKRPVALLLLVITATLWSLGGLLIKSVELSPLAIAGIRSGISAVVLLIFLRKPSMKFSKTQLGAIIAYVGTVVLFVASNKMTTAANAILLQYTAPIYVAILGTWLLKEKTKTVDWIVVLIVVGGMAMFFLDDLSMNGMLGNIVACLSGVSFALFTVFMRMQKNGNPLESVFWGNVVTALIGIPFLFQATPSKSGWGVLILLGVVQLGIPYVLYSIAIKHVTALEAILIPVIEPILNPVWVFLLLGEAPSYLACIGGLIVLSAVTARYILPILWRRGTGDEQAI